MLRTAIILGIVLVLFLPFNLLTYRQLVRIHPRRRKLVIAAVVVGNLMWLFFPILNARTDFSRFIRATLGPPWCAWTVFAILYSGAILLMFLAWLPLRRRPFAEFARWPSRAFISFILLGSAVGFFQALVPLRVERVPIAIPNLPPELEGKRLALLADLHVGLYTRPSRLQTIFSTTAALQPDVVFILGDLLDDDPHFAPKLLAGARALPSSLPVYAVLGNHEIYGGPQEVIAKLRGSRIRLLVNEGVPLGRLWIAGISDYAARSMPQGSGLVPDADKALSGRAADSLPILIAHQPTAFGDARKRHIPLTLCAHTHGGQCGFRPLRWTLAGLFLPYHIGLYEVGGAQLYVNTGTGYWLLPFRLGMTPEITLVDLRRG